MSDIFREVEEEVRRDQLLKLWKKYGAVAIAVVAVIVLGVAGYQGWNAYQAQQRQAASEAYAAAEAQLAGGDTQAAQESFAELSDPDAGGHALLASFQAARLAAEAGEMQAAIEGWAKIGQSGAEPAYRDAAMLAAGRMLLDSGEAEEAESQLEPLTAAGRPYRALAAEIYSAAALQLGDEAAAIEVLREVSADTETPASVRERASQVLATIGEQ